MSLVRRRQLLMAVHRYLGLVVMLFLAIASLTGCVLCFEQPLDRWLNPDLYRSTGLGSVAPIVAVTRFERSHPNVAATYFPIKSVSGHNIPVLVEPRRGSPALGYDQLFLDGGDGHLVGVRENRPGLDRAHIVRGIYQLHCSLLAGTAGRLIMGVAALIWLVGNIIGVYITLPFKRPLLRHWRRAWAFRRSRTLRQTCLDLHRVCGLWLLGPLSVLALTSLAMSFYDEGLRPAVNILSPPHPSPFDRPAPAGGRAAPAFSYAFLLDRAKAIAAAHRLSWRPAIIQQDPERGLVGVRFTPSGQDDYRALGPVTEWFDASGRLVYEDNPYADSFGMATERSLYPLHTGQAIGTPGVLLDVVLGLVTLFLGLSGFYLWLKRQQGQRLARMRRAETCA